MSRVSTNLNISEYVSASQLKKKLKTYLNELNCDNFKISSYSKGLIYCLVLVLEEMLSDCIKHVVKNETNGLYHINQLIINTIINENSKYSFVHKYVKSFNPVVRYHESVFFNIKKVLDNLESKYGSKLMIDTNTVNFISYLILSIQYDLVNLSIRMVKYSKKRTLNIQCLASSSGFIFSEEISSKIDLKLDSMEDKNIEVEEEQEGEGEGEEEDETESEANA